MIPPGIHFIYYSVSDKHGNIGIRSGFFYNFKTKEILLKKWDKQGEIIDTKEPTNEEIERICLNKKDLDRYLAPYPFDEYKKWISLSNFLNEQMLNNLLPLSGIITSETALIGNKFKKSRTDDRASAEGVKSNLFQIPKNLKDAESQLPIMSENEEARIRFTKMIDHKFPQSSNASQITKHAIDMSYNLELLLSLSFDSKYENLLCELQFSFICFLIGYVYDGFEQWKHLMNLLCNSEDIIQKLPNLYLNLIQILYFQLKEIPEDFFVDIITRNNFLIITLHNLFDNIESIEETVDEIIKLKDKAKKFRAYLKEELFDFDNEPDEYAPTICE
jgi:A1 cistron-splicing factor AAR2